MSKINSKKLTKQELEIQNANQIIDKMECQALREKTAATWIHEGVVCAATNLPDRGFGETKMTIYGITEQFPFHSEYATLDCIFLTPLFKQENPIPRIFQKWQNLIQDMSSGYAGSTKDFTFSGTGPDNGYYGNIHLGMFDNHNALSLSYAFERVYPKVVQSTPVNWHEEHEITKLGVNFTYSTWTLLPTVTPQNGLFNTKNPAPNFPEFPDIPHSS